MMLAARCLLSALLALLTACAATPRQAGHATPNPRIVERDLGADALTSTDERKPAATR
ncbi:hypothetical protein [Rhizobacter sp. SG703]|uniref:hypothetical protein n=1 Tax=Rhizobacter sp. SG703 TaxID=2587140 RepID=UPI001445A032|nr:hypothetical protein [Rhizobacter sp. SG703]NKI94852.1 hypothetical protein [Rhizobacter sp. SG703]